MTFEERLAELGVDLSDLPLGYSLSAEKAKSISDIACRWFVDEDTPDGVALRNLVSIPLFQYILHLVDVIDRMETRIVNLTGERDWLLEYYGANDGIDSCSLCIHSEEPCDSAACAKCSYSGPSQFERADVPEEWRVDDA